MLDNTQNFLSESFDRVRGFASSAKDAVVTKGLEMTGDVGGAVVDVVGSYGKMGALLGAVMIPTALATGGSVTDGAVLTTLFTVFTGHFGLLHTLPRAQEGLTMGSKLQDYCHDVHDNYVEHNDMPSSRYLNRFVF